MNEPIVAAAAAPATTAPSSAMGAPSGAGMGNPAQMVQMLAAMPQEQRALFAQSLGTYYNITNKSRTRHRHSRFRVILTSFLCFFPPFPSFCSHCFVFLLLILSFFWDDPYGRNDARSIEWVYANDAIDASGPNGQNDATNRWNGYVK